METMVKPKEQNSLKTFSEQISLKPIWIMGYIFLMTLTGYKSHTDAQGKILHENEYTWGLKKSGKKDSTDWSIYSRKIKGSAFKAFKISGVIEVAPAKAVEALRYKMEHGEKFYTEDEGYIKILNNTPAEALIYSMYSLPFPFRDRSMCERFLFFENRETGIHRITWQEEWNAAPPEKKNVVRMPVARGSWEFIPNGPDRSNATYIVHAEPGGIIPAWMVNPTVSKGLPDELKNIEEIAKLLK